MTRFRTVARRLSVSAVLVVAAGLGTGAVAEAAPAAVAEDCTFQLYSFGARAWCGVVSNANDNYLGQFRAAVRCDKNNGFDYDRYGAWVWPGNWSFADCNSGDRPFSPRAQAR